MKQLYKPGILSKLLAGTTLFLLGGLLFGSIAIYRSFELQHKQEVFFSFDTSLHHRLDHQMQDLEHYRINELSHQSGIKIMHLGDLLSLQEYLREMELEQQILLTLPDIKPESKQALLRFSDLFTRYASLSREYLQAMTEGRLFTKETELQDAYEKTLTSLSSLVILVDEDVWYRLAAQKEYLHATIFILVFLLVLFLLLGVGLAFWLSSSIVSPLRELEKGVRLFEEGREFQFSEKKREDEIGKLLLSFEKMAETIRSNHALLERQAKEATESSERVMVYSHAFQNSIDAMSISSMDGKLLSWNIAYQTLYGVTGEKLLSASFLDIEKGGDDNPLSILYQVRKEGFYAREIRQERYNGKAFFAYVTKSLIRDNNGKPLGIIGITRDVSERKEFEYALERRERFLASILDAMENQICILNKEGIIVKVNDAWNSFYQDAETATCGVGVNYLDVCKNASSSAGSGSDDAQVVMWGITTMLKKDDMKHFRFEYSCEHQGVRRFFVLSMNRFSMHGETSLVLVHHDVTKLKKAEETMRMKELLFRTTFENVNVALCLYGDYFLKVNSMMVQMSGYSEEELKQCSPLDVFSSLPWQQEGWLKEDEEEDQCLPVVGEDIELICKGGEKKWVHYSAVRLGYEGMPAILASFIDVTEDRALRKELSEKTEELEGLNRELEYRVEEEVSRRKEQSELLLQQSRLASMGEMISDIAHQWLEPLTVLRLVIDSLHDQFEDGELDSESFSQFTEEAYQQIRFMKDTVYDFRSFFRPAKKKTVFTIREIIDKSLSLLLSRLQYDIDVDVLCEDDTLCVHGYPNLFSHCIINLVKNSRDAILERQNRGELLERKGKISIHILYVPDNHTVLIQLKDNGGGIPSEILNTLYDPYVTTKGNVRGTGLGLYMTKTIIEEHMHGVIWGENIDDGAQFSIMLPSALKV